MVLKVRLLEKENEKYDYSQVVNNMPGKSRDQDFKMIQSINYNSWGLENFSICSHELK